MAGGTVTISGGNVIHTFTSTGFLAPIELVNNSLRFRSSASAYLNRTPSTASNRKTWTWSGWVKRGTLGATNRIFTADDGSASTDQDYNTLFFTSSDQIKFAGNLTDFRTTTAVYRDPAAWYHVVFVCDTTQATAANRFRLYVNGTEVTAFGTSNNPTQNTDLAINASIAHYIGSISPSGASYFDGYMTEINFIDGQQLTPSSFGTINSYGVWQPITYGGSYGTNGFYLPFPNNSTGAAVSTSYLVVAGGGGGGRDAASGASNAGGGGGAGGYLASTTSLASTGSYVVTVGAGGAGGAVNSNGASGSNSVLTGNGVTITSTGGGGGARNSTGLTGGSGGGGANSAAGGSAVSGQGFAGGASTGFASGGGGGASAAGNTGHTTNSGGAGLASSITGTSVTRAGGGGGGTYNGAGGAGGTGGGGAGSTNAGNATSGTANTGGGGGGVGSDASGVTGSSGAGGSGVVIVSYAGTQRYTGGTVTSSGGNTIHTFNSSGVLTSIFNDFSPQGNNWTGNNFDVTNTTASTYDSMTDVPTLTSATAANYAVMNPLSTLYTVTAGNLDFTYTNSTNGVWYLKGTLAVSSDKYYWEVTPTNVGAGQNISIGIILSTNTQTNTTTINLVTDGYVYHCDGNKYSGATSAAYGATYTNNDVIGVALDLTAGTLVFYKNNVSQGTAYTGLTSSYMQLICNHLGGASRTVAGFVNAGQRPFTYTPPSGFVALNTYNL
jgi:hypothetical protein